MSKDEFREALMELFAEWQKYNQTKDKSDKSFDDLKFWRGILVGIVLTVFGWLVTNYSSQEPVIIIIGIGIFIIASIFSIALSSAISSKFD